MWAGLVIALMAWGVLLGIGGTMIALKLRSGPQVDRVLREAWSPMTKPDANVLLVAATPLHLTVGPEGHEAYGTPAYPAPPEPTRTSSNTDRSHRA
jgi:hypothetical protein